ncbi:MAG: 50S ribosomal protein L23 [Alphaproteobacteria bacterium]
MNARLKKPVRISEGRMMEIVRSPLITEKTSLMSEHNHVAFRVPLDATKGEIKAAVETLFKVKVDGVNTIRSKGKRKVFRGERGRRPDWKKAMVRLAEGESIDVTTGL